MLNKNISRFSIFLKKLHLKHDNTHYIHSAIKNDFIKDLEKFDSIILCAHGSREEIYHRMSYTSQKQHQILLAENNVSYLKNKNIIAISCSSAHTLGEKAINKGCKSYLGFKRNIHFQRKNKNTPKLFYNLLRKCYIDVFYKVLDIAITQKLTIGSIKLILKNELSIEIDRVCSDFESNNFRLYKKYYLNELYTTIADVIANIEVLGDSKEILS